MFQSFESPASPEQGPARLALLRAELTRRGLSGFLIPRADAHQGEYVAARDDRLAWATGFTGSAGFCIVLPEIAGVFIDGRYRTQVKAQVDLAHFTPVPWPETQAGPWIAAQLDKGVIGFDPWLHSLDEIARIRTALNGRDIELRALDDNPLDTIWDDQPAPPAEPIFIHPVALAGEDHAARRRRIGAMVAAQGAATAVITLPDSLCWLLNIRGGDVPRNPVVHGFALLDADGAVTLFTALSRVDQTLRDHLGPEVRLAAPEAFLPALAELQGPVLVDPKSAPLAVNLMLAASHIDVVQASDPCILPKAVKTEAELAGMREAHLRDGAAVVGFQAWLTRRAPDEITEIDAIETLEAHRRATNLLHDISFDTISGAGPNGAIIHYRASHATNRTWGNDELLLVDSGAQYKDGTTDITRTFVMGTPSDEERDAYTRVLRGLIAISRARFPRGLAGRDLDALARQHLWAVGRDYDHGTGHGVGAFLSVHEGPQRLSRISEVPLAPGMILSNEPGYYREGAFGIRLENLIVVREAPALGDNRDQLCFETLTFVPFERRLIDADQLSREERAWLDAYHAEVLQKIGPRVAGEELAWLQTACATL